MKGVTILDRDSNRDMLSFDLRDILCVLGSDGERSVWTIRHVECLGGSAAVELNDASETQRVLPGVQLTQLARAVDQVVDGEFSARLPGNERDWVTIRAVDSSAFDVETDRDDVLAALKAKFDQVVDLPA